MNKSFENYYQEYLKKYNKLPLEKINIKKEKQNTKFLLLIPFIFIFVFTLTTKTELNYQSKEINLLYSEKYIYNNSNIQSKKSIHQYTNKRNFNLPLTIKENSINKFASISDNFKNYTLDVFSDSRINFSKSEKVVSLPEPNWKKDYSPKKIEFIETLLPLITFQNQQIVIERKKLFKMADYLKDTKTLKKDDILYLNNLAKKYKINIKNIHKIDLVNELLHSVDIIPNSIVLAQAANESGWGTSRFAKEYNALFGQYTYDENNGVIPFDRDEGKKHLIKYFPSIDKSVESYFHNINSHYAYSKFRDIRSQMNKKDIDIKLLTETLDVYAEDKFYVDTINKIIDSNNFTQFDLIGNIFTSS